MSPEKLFEELAEEAGEIAKETPDPEALARATQIIDALSHSFFKPRAGAPDLYPFATTRPLTEFLPIVLTQKLDPAHRGLLADMLIYLDVDDSLPGAIYGTIWP